MSRRGQPRRRLAVKRETLRRLGWAELTIAVGGINTTNTGFCDTTAACDANTGACVAGYDKGTQVPTGSKLCQSGDR